MDRFEIENFLFAIFYMTKLSVRKIFLKKYLTSVKICDTLKLKNKSMR